jgi:hypothetical protein
MAAWSGTLPQNFQVQGYVETGAENTIRTRMEVGPDKVRKRTTSDVRTVVGNMWLTPAQYTELRTFYEVTHEYGALSFTKDDEHGISRTWRFVSPPIYSTNGPENWQVRLSIEEMP